MNANDPLCNKTPIRAALEDTITVFIYSFLAAAAVVLVSDNWEAKAFVLPVCLAAIQGVITYARKRNIDLPSREEGDDQ